MNNNIPIYYNIKKGTRLNLKYTKNNFEIIVAGKEGDLNYTIKKNSITQKYLYKIVKNLLSNTTPNLENLNEECFYIATLMYIEIERIKKESGDENE